MTTAAPSAAAANHTHSSADTVAWGILGAGAIAKAFARGLAQSQTGRLAAVASRSQAKADAFGKEFGAPTCHGSYEALLADPAVQAVYVATPHPMHAPWAIKAARAGKHILCEKPAALNHAQAMAMIEAARASNVFFMEAFMYRCHAQTAKLVELIRGGAIGQVRMIRASFGFQGPTNPQSRLMNSALGGGGILDVGCYPVSMARLIAGAAVGKPFADPDQVQAVGHIGETHVDEYAAAVLRFPATSASGPIVAQVATAVQAGLENSLRVVGSEGSIFVPNPWTAGRTEGGRFVIHVQARGKDAEEIVLESDRTAYALEIDVAGGAIAAGRVEASVPAMTWGDTLGNMRTLDQWRERIGLIHEGETPEALTRPIHGGDLVFQSRPGPKMKYGRIPGLDKDVSRFVMGCDNQQTLAHGSVMWDDWFERGGNAFDTGYIYGGGTPEKLLGQWIHSRGIREQTVILAKGAHTPHCNPDALSKQLIESLERMQTDYADIYVMHRDNPDIPVSEFIDVLNEHKDAGRIRVFGGSNWSIERFEEANAYAKKAGKEPMTLLSNNFSLARMVDPVWRGCVAASDPGSRAWLEKTQTPVLAWSSQARGFFTDRAGPDKRDDKELVRCWYSEDNFQRRERAIELAEKKGVLPINIAAAYVLCQPSPLFALIGPRVLHETTTSLPALDIELTPDEVKWLNLEA